MITQDILIKEIDDGCYGKCNDKAKDTLIKNIETLEDLESLNEINEYEVDKAFLDKMKYIKEHKNETDNLVYTGGLDFFKSLKQELEEKFADDWKLWDGLRKEYRDTFAGKIVKFNEKLNELREKLDDEFKEQIKEVTEATSEFDELKEKIVEIKNRLEAEKKLADALKIELNEVIEAISNTNESKKELAEAESEFNNVVGRFNAECNDFMEHYEVTEAPDIEITEAVLKNLDTDDVYILYVTEDDGYLFLGKDYLVRSIDNTGKEIASSKDYVWYSKLKEDKTKFYVYRYNIFLYVE